MMSRKSLSVFIPVYNEDKIIDDSMLAILEVIESIADDYEILIVNDGSTDNSKEKILKWVEKCDRVKLIEHKTNLGYGLALRDGFKNATKDLIFYTDMDIPVDLNEIRKTLPLMEVYDLVIGYRINREDTPRRFIYSKIYNLLLRILFNVKAKDANFSFKCVKRAVIEKINLTAKSGFIDGELLAEAIRNNFSIKEIPLIYRPRKYGKSNFDGLKTAIFTAKEIVFYWLVNVCLLKARRGNADRTV